MAAPSSKRKTRISLWLPADIHERLKRAAAADDRTVVSFVIAVLRRALDDFEAARKK